MQERLFQETRKIYTEVFGDLPKVEAWGPGRVNLIGEHTDYNQGFVLPLAVDRGVFLAGQERSDHQVALYSVDYKDQVEFQLNHLHKDPAHPWADYVKGVLEQFQKRGLKLRGFQAVLAGNLPQGAGLSSSASLEVATAVFLEKMNQIELPDLDLIQITQAAENQFVGVQCGIMDQFVSHLGKKKNALWIDCRNLKYEWVPIPSSLKMVVCNTGVKRRLEQSAYNQRRLECEEAVQILSSVLPSVKFLRDVSPTDFRQHQNLLPPVILKRCRHVVSENQRVLDMVGALKAGNLTKMGQLLYESHDSLKNDYEVSCEELDVLVEVARRNSSVLGGRMTGAGFGGCTVNLVPEAQVDRFCQEGMKSYQNAFGRSLEIYVFSPSDGAKCGSPSLEGGYLR